MSLIHVTKENFAEVKASDKPVLLDFFATWCGPCRMIAPFIEQIADEHPEYVICKIDVDEEPELAQAFGIMSIPTLVVMKDGKIVRQESGARPKAQILALIEG
jgi:thioredoxin 1